MSDARKPPHTGYGNIYTPHAGSMIIQVQRESGLANRTIVLSPRQVRGLRVAGYAAGLLLVAGVTSWLFFAAQASRVPFLTRRVAALQHDVRRLDSLHTALDALERRFQRVQQMLGAAARPAATWDPATSPTDTASAEPTSSARPAGR